MTHLKRYKYHMLAAAILIALALAGVKTRVADVTEVPQELPRVHSQGQLEHALELFPRKQQTHLFSLESEADQRPYLLSLVKQSLPEAFQNKAFEITRAVIVESNHHHMDPLFLLAVIATESKFNPLARGTHGEIGLMQILPKTAEWMAAQSGIEASKINLEDPATNIRIGATYFALLRKNFKNNGRRYVSAYNMGSTNVRRLVKARIEPNIYAQKVLANYTNFYAKIETNTEVRAIATAN